MVRVRRAARLLVGPLALAGFFLPWATGPGVLSGERYSGFDLVGVADRLQVLDLAPASAAGLWGVRALIIGVAVAACWQTALALLAPWHRAYAASGWYIVVTATGAVAAGALRSGMQVPPLGVALWATGALIFLVCEAERLPRGHAGGRAAVEPCPVLEAQLGPRESDVARL